jgi:hypothetical protein
MLILIFHTFNQMIFTLISLIFIFAMFINEKLKSYNEKYDGFLIFLLGLLYASPRDYTSILIFFRLNFSSSSIFFSACLLFTFSSLLLEKRILSSSCLFNYSFSSFCFNRLSLSLSLLFSFFSSIILLLSASLSRFLSFLEIYSASYWEDC